MRCSAWSSRAIWACSATLAALALAPGAGAARALTLVPQTVEPGAEVMLTFATPNRGGATVDHVTLGIPSDFVLDDAEAKPGWVLSRTEQAITWSGGRIPKGEFATFAIRGKAPMQLETVLFNVIVGARGGKSTTYHVGLSVSPAANHDTGARSLGRAGLIVAIVGLALALAAGFLALGGWLRTSPRPPED
jgi:uncharacterized protein YcnI